MCFKNDKNFEVEEKQIGDLLVAGIRFKGRYCDCGKAFAQLGRKMGANICGKALDLYYDLECKEVDADIESCMPIRKEKNIDGISVKTLPGGHCVSLIHRGPYETVGQSYKKIIAYMQAKNYQPRLPIRQVYLKGPGMIFRGNPEKYLTEIQILTKAPDQH
jgi:effector-binding domain-containing protein